MNSNKRDIETIINILLLMKNEDETVDDSKLHSSGLRYLLG